MPRPAITAAALREVLHYDPEAGIFVWRVHRRNGASIGDRAGCPNYKGYRMIGIDGRYYSEQRLAWLYMTAEWPSVQIDHKNTDKGDNRWDNLREASNGQNKANTGLQRNNKSGFKGVSWFKNTNRWVSVIYAGGKRHYLGYFHNPEDAHAAYVAAAVRLHGEFARVE